MYRFLLLLIILIMQSRRGLLKHINGQESIPGEDSAEFLALDFTDYDAESGRVEDYPDFEDLS